jgi:hypothetical protein
VRKEEKRKGGVKRGREKLFPPPLEQPWKEEKEGGSRGF